MSSKNPASSEYEESNSNYDSIDTPKNSNNLVLETVPIMSASDPSGPARLQSECFRPSKREELNKNNSLSSNGSLISVHGYLHKQGKRVIKGPLHKSWKRRYFALEKAKIYYFQSHLDCRQYFSTRNLDLVVGAVELRSALGLRPSARLDLPHKGFEIVTKRRIWVLCPESEDEYDMWFEAIEKTIISEGNDNVVERKLPNVRKYLMKGNTTYHILYYLFIIAGLVEIFGLIFWFIIGVQPCDPSRPDVGCKLIVGTSLDELSCQEKPFNGWFEVPKFWLELADVEDVQCFHTSSTPQWLAYFALLFAEILSFTLAALYYLAMWKPVRRGAQYLDEFSPKFPKEEWPTVDVLICHYSEPAEDTIDTLAACLQLDYPPHLLHIWILDDGYCKAKWKKNEPTPTIELNKGIIESAGDLRQEVAQLMYDRIQSTDDMEVYAWRKLHSSANLPTASNPRVVNRADCAVGSFRDDYKYTGFPQVSFIGRIKPPVHFSKAGNINNCLYNEGANGRYLMILDNDMQPHPKFVLATLPFFFGNPDKKMMSSDLHSNKRLRGKGGHGNSTTIDVPVKYSDHVSNNAVGFVQTPQYFNDELLQELGDPLGHRNATFYDAIQTGQDGYDCASFAGTNAMFRRQALDSVAGIQYGSLTEDAYTGQMINAKGWKNLYFRKDFEGDRADRIRLAAGSIPESVAASLAQRKRWAKGNFQIYLSNNKNHVDPEWKRPHVEVPRNTGKNDKFMKRVFFLNNTIYPLGSYCALSFYYVTLYFLYSGMAPIYLNGLKLLFGLIPKLLIQSLLAALSNRTVENNDVVRSQEAWFGYSWVHCLAVIEALYWKITGKEASWANTGGIKRGSIMELPNILVFFGGVFGIIWSVVRFFAGYNTNETSHGASLLMASLLMGTFLVTKLAPMVKMSIQEYFGWSYNSLTDHGNFMGSAGLAFGLSFIALWVYIEQPNASPY